jgi:glycosyltransferase involved in cell wall biosynthesis
VALRVLVLLPYPTNQVPGQRFRIEQWAPHLHQEGLEVTLSPFLAPSAMGVLYGRGRSLSKVRETIRAYLGRLRVLRRLGSYDVAFVHREAVILGSARLERFVAKRLPVVYDFDDAIYLGQANTMNPWAAWLRDSGKTEALCRLARHVTVGNDILAAYARPRASAVTVLPTTIDTEAYVVRGRPPHSRPVLGWSGSVTTLPYLAAMRDTLLRLRQRLDFELRVIGGELEVPGLDVRCRPWRAETEVEDLQALDVGIMPLPDDPWTRGKCGLKALQYMALGIPAVVSPVGVNAEIVRDGENGFLASTPEEWVARAAMLLTNAELRRRLGSAARRTVEDRYSARVHAPRLAKILREAVAG